MQILAYVATALLYAGLAIYFWRTQWTPAVASGPDTAARAPRPFEQYAVLVPLALHSVLLARSLFASDGLHLGLANAVSAILWLTVLIYWLSNFVYHLDGLQALVLPLAAAASMLPGVMAPAGPLPNSEFIAFKVHFVIAMLAYSFFTIASLHVVLMALVERRLHDGTLTHVLRGLPPLLTMEALLFRIIWAGFILLTLTLASGVVFSEEIFGKPAPVTHKTVFGAISWLIFAALLAGRHFAGWRGRVAVRWTLAGFLALVLAYIGSQFVLEVLLGRS
jgi:ABC-type uncharacterized transport system permease subunit